MLRAAKHLLGFARLKVVRHIIGWMFAHMSFALPVDRLYESQDWVAFYHPSPSYPFHVLLVPKRAIPNLASLEAADTPLLAELVQVVRLLVTRFNLEGKGYRLITNGGPYQDIPQLHFHLVSDEAMKE
jgi:histidine triad (HIT) family protein